MKPDQTSPASSKPKIMQVLASKKKAKLPNSKSTLPPPPPPQSTKPAFSPSDDTGTDSADLHVVSDDDEGDGSDLDSDDYCLTGDAGAGGRLLHGGEEDGEQKSPIAGLFPKDKPIPETLEKSLSQVADQMPTCKKLIKMAKKKAKKVAKRLKQYKHIPQHMLAAIVFYTIEEKPKEHSPYFILNKALRGKNRKDVVLWKDYIWLLLNALKHVRASDSRLLFRGLDVGSANLGPEYDEGGEFVWSAFSSTSTTVGVMIDFMDMETPRTLFQLELTERVGRDLRDFSLHPGENEILLPPNMAFEVVSRLDSGSGLTMVQCKQVDADDEILSLSDRSRRASLHPQLDAKTDAADITRLKAEAAKAVQAAESKAVEVKHAAAIQTAKLGFALCTNELTAGMLKHKKEEAEATKAEAEATKAENAALERLVVATQMEAATAAKEKEEAEKKAAIAAKEKEEAEKKAAAALAAAKEKEEEIFALKVRLRTMESASHIKEAEAAKKFSKEWKDASKRDGDGMEGAAPRAPAPEPIIAACGDEDSDGDDEVDSDDFDC